MNTTMKRYTIKPNRHDFRPREFPRPFCTRNLSLHWSFSFHEDCRYTLDQGDQYDWNKGGGISFHLLRNDLDSVMWGWRYSPAKDLIEITAYSNRKDAPNGRITGWGQDQVMLNLPFNEQGECVIEHLGGGRYAIQFLRFGSSNPQQAIHEMRKPYRLAKRTGLWFGGNRKAPHRMTVDIDFNIF